MIYLLSLFYFGLSVMAMRLFPAQVKKRDYYFIGVSVVMIAGAFFFFQAKGLLGGALVFHVIAIVLTVWRMHLKTRECFQALKESVDEEKDAIAESHTHTTKEIIHVFHQL